jgi:transposase InsO family protein
MMTARTEFVRLASVEGAVFRELCRRFGVSPTTGYKWLKRYRKGIGIEDQSRRPRRSPRKTAAEIEAEILALREATHWGGRKIAWTLNQRHSRRVITKGGVCAVLRRNGCIDPDVSQQHQAFIRFEHLRPNDLWQLDFMGPFPTGAGECKTLTAIDDHSRFSLIVRACANQQTETVRAALTEAFRSYGLPWRITMDNGSPWGDPGQGRLTVLTAWLVRLGIGVSHSRPYHPQTQGKDERLHETLRYELVRWINFRDLDHAQREFDPWRQRYNFERPHESLDMNPPAQRYRISERSMPEKLPPIEYNSCDEVRRVNRLGHISYRSRKVYISKACIGLDVAIRPTLEDGKLDVYFCHQRIASIDLRDGRWSEGPSESPGE